MFGPINTPLILAFDVDGSKTHANSNTLLSRSDQERKENVYQTRMFGPINTPFILEFDVDGSKTHSNSNTLLSRSDQERKKMFIKPNLTYHDGSNMPS
ncbi:hypothetical protein TNCV_1825461 [Trichonephila clavipes]|nr:hypothetical protein TNCV_1825461 [Trichonephila clavipes]